MQNKREILGQGLAPAVKKALSLLLAMVMLFSITAGIDLSAYAGESWLWPVASSTNMSQGYSSKHDGLDITGANNCSIRAAMSGTVVYSHYGDIPNAYYGGGNFVVIKHSNGYYSHYAHLNSRSVSQGQTVKQGQEIGKMGSTGNSTGTHLHFAIATSQYGSGGRINNNPGAISYIYSAKPAKPTNLNVQTVNEKLNISWNASAGATSYIVYIYSKANCSEYVYKNQVTTTYINNISVKPGRYWIYVHAVNSAGASEGCGPFDYLGCPTNVKYRCYENKVKITWNSVSGANCYDVIVTDPSGTTNWYHTDGTEKEITLSKKGGYRFNIQSLYRKNGSTNGQIVGAHSSEGYFEFYMNGPSNVNVNSVGNKLKVTWNAVQGANCYDVIVTDPSGTTNWYHTTGTNKEITVSKTGLYSIDVQSLYRPNGNTTGQVVGAHSKVVSYKLNSIEAKLSAPTLKVSVNSNGTFKMTWNKVSGADKYEIYYKQADGSYKLLKTVTGTSYTSGFAQYGKQYSYKMKAVKGNTKSDYSKVVNATNNKKLQTPTLKVAVNSNGTFKMTWNKVTGATSYQIYYKQANGSYKLLKTVSGTSYTSGFAQYGKQYSYKMRAVTSKNSSATSNYSSVVNAKNTKKLGTPTMKAAVNKNGSFKLSWGKVTGATSYQIYWKQANGSYKLLKTVSGTSYTTVVAAKGKTYSYKVRAVTKNNKNATSNYSNVVNAKRK